MSDEILFTATDPRGRRVICTKAQWDDHIILNHSDMVGEEPLVQLTIEQPSFGIYQDVTNPDRHIYYRRGPGETMNIKVVVEFAADDTGIVITAYFTVMGKGGEKLLWLG